MLLEFLHFVGILHFVGHPEIPHFVGDPVLEILLEMRIPFGKSCIGKPALEILYWKSCMEAEILYRTPFLGDPALQVLHWRTYIGFPPFSEVLYWISYLEMGAGVWPLWSMKLSSGISRVPLFAVVVVVVMVVCCCYMVRSST